MVNHETEQTMNVRAINCSNIKTLSVPTQCNEHMAISEVLSNGASIVLQNKYEKQLSTNMAQD